MRQANYSHREVFLYFWSLLCVDRFTCRACSNMVNVCEIFASRDGEKLLFCTRPHWICKISSFRSSVVGEPGLLACGADSVPSKRRELLAQRNSVISQKTGFLCLYLQYLHVMNVAEWHISTSIFFSIFKDVRLLAKQSNLTRYRSTELLHVLLIFLFVRKICMKDLYLFLVKGKS